jgi:hypothetical protein
MWEGGVEILDKKIIGTSRHRGSSLVLKFPTVIFYSEVSNLAFKLKTAQNLN